MREVAFLHRAVTAYRIWQLGQFHSQTEVVRRYRSQEFVEQLFVILQPMPLDLALLGVAERIEPGVAHEFQLGQQLETLEHPGAEALLGWLSAGLGLVEHRRREVKTQAVIAFE